MPQPGFFSLYPFAEPPLPAGRYTLTGEVAGLPGPVEPLTATVDIVSPRYALPPDQILSTFPPAGARGAFTSRLPQIVLRRRTLPWERSPDLEPGGTPTPWLALVLLAEGEGELRADQPVEQCVTPGLTLDPDRDVPKGAYVEVPERVVRAVFPTVDDLKLLTHVREVDITDTELALGDDDGWMAVVLANRLPQANTRYLACLINLEGQYERLPTAPPEELEYDRFAFVADLRVAAAQVVGAAAGLDQAVMGLPGAQAIAGAAVSLPLGATAAGATTPVIRSATGRAAPTGSGWATSATTTAGSAIAAGQSASHASFQAAGAKLALADGFAFPAALLLEPTFRFPVLAYWSFTCEERGDFQYLAEHITSRLLGYVPDPEVPETPDGDEPPAGGPQPPGARPEPAAPRPLPLVAETGHLVLGAVTRRGDAAEAWFRGPLAPTPVERADERPDGAPRPPLAHHADQLRRVVPDGREDLGYAAAFEIGRLLALSQPGIVAALGQWRQEAFGAARVRSAADDAILTAPGALRDLAARPDPLTDDTADRLRPGGAGRRAARALVQLLGEQPELLAPARPMADPGAAAEELRALLPDGRDKGLLAGLGLAQTLGDDALKDAATAAATLARTPVRVSGKRDLDADVAALRQALEAEAGRLADAAGGGQSPGSVLRPLGGSDE